MGRWQLEIRVLVFCMELPDIKIDLFIYFNKHKCRNRKKYERNAIR